MYYEKQPDEMKNNYKAMLQIMGSLSRLFSESDEPYLYYRSHENIFAKYFELENNSRHDDSADAYSRKDKIGIGLKTWVGKNEQKIAEFGKIRCEYADLDEEIDIVKVIAEHRNKRIQFTKNSHKLDTMIYHIVKRVTGEMHIYEISYDPIDISNIKLDTSRGTYNNIYFSDGKHDYHFSLSKNTLYMNFDKMVELDHFPVKIIADPYEVLSTLMKDTLLEKKKQPLKHKPFTPKDISEAVNSSVPERNQLCLRLYATKPDGTKYVPEKSGLNQWNADGRARDDNEIYIPYLADDRARSEGFFPPKDKPFELLLPDGEWISAKVCQGAYAKMSDDKYILLNEAEKEIEDKKRQTGKAIMSNPNLKLGKWLLRDVFELAPKTLVTYEMLKLFNVDSVIFTKLSDNKFTIDFCTLGTYEKMYNLNDIDEND